MNCLSTLLGLLRTCGERPGQSFMLMHSSQQLNSVALQ